MNSKILIAAVLIAAAAAGGHYVGKNVGKKATSKSAAPDSTIKIEVSDNIEQAPAKERVAADTRIKAGPAGLANDIEVTVKNGESIQAAVTAAKPGTTIYIQPGTYSQTVYIDKDNIRLIGIIEEGKRATLDGKGELNDAILYSGNNVVVENLNITQYKGNGIMGQAGNNFEIRNNIIADTGVYGIFPQLGKNGVVEYNVVSGIEDAAIYVGMSDNVHVAHNDVFDSVAGIEIENSRHAIVENNYVHNNTGGVLAFITPGLPIKTTYDVIIRNNFIVGNNHDNFGAPGSTVAGIPAGTGVLIMAADQVIVENNIISDNKTTGILITDHAHAANITADPESEPNPDNIMILDNTMINNGYDTIASIKAMMLSEFTSVQPDLVHVSEGKNNCIINRSRYKTLGLKSFADCAPSTSENTLTYLLDEPVPARKISAETRGKTAYLGVCTGCHSYNGRLIGPSIQTIQALYFENPEGLAAYIANPVKKRQDYPEMPSQAYLGDETLQAVAEYVLSREK